MTYFNNTSFAKNIINQIDTNKQLDSIGQSQLETINTLIEI